MRKKKIIISACPYERLCPTAYKWPQVKMTSKTGRKQANNWFGGKLLLLYFSSFVRYAIDPYLDVLQEVIFDVSRCHNILRNLL